MLIYLDMLIRCYLTFPSCPCLLATLQPPACSVLFHMAEAINCNAIFLACLYIIFSGCPSLSSPAWLTGIPIMDSTSPSASWVNWAWCLQWPSDHLGFQTRSPRSSADLACTSPRNLAATCAGMMRRDCAWPAALAPGQNPLARWPA